MAPREPLSVSHPRRGRHQGSERLRRVTPVMRYRDPSGGIHALTAASSAPPARHQHYEAGTIRRTRSSPAVDSSSITVVRAKVEVTVGTGHDVAEAAELSVEQTFLRDDPARVGGQSKEMRSAKSGDEEIVRELRNALASIERDTGWRNGGRVEHDWRLHSRSSCRPLDVRPAIIGSRLNHIDFVVAAWAVFRGPEISGGRMPVDALWVAMSKAEHRRAESVAWCGCTARCDP